MVTRSIRRTKNTLFNRGFINFNNKFNNKFNVKFNSEFYNKFNNKFNVKFNIEFYNKFNNKLIKDRTSLNRMKWNKDGTKILVGDALGKISIYETDKNVIYIF